MIIDGKAIAAQVKASLQGSNAKLAVIMVGDDPASSVYVRNKERACAEVGIQSCSRRLPATASTEEVIASIAELSAWADGIFVQLPPAWYPFPLFLPYCGFSVMVSYRP